MRVYSSFSLHCKLSSRSRGRGSVSRHGFSSVVQPTSTEENDIERSHLESTGARSKFPGVLSRGRGCRTVNDMLSENPTFKCGGAKKRKEKKSKEESRRAA